MKTMLLIFLLILSASAMAQDRKPRAVEPIRAEIVTKMENSEIDGKLHKAFRAELNKKRAVALGTAKADWRIYLGITVVTLDGTPRGYAGALMLIDRTGEIYWLSVKTHSNIEGLAQAFVASLDAEVFNMLRRPQ